MDTAPQKVALIIGFVQNFQTQVRARARFSLDPRGLLNLFVNLPKSANRGGGYTTLIKNLNERGFFGRFRAGVCFPGGRFLSRRAFAFRAGIFFPGRCLLSGRALFPVFPGFLGFLGFPGRQSPVVAQARLSPKPG